MTDYNRAIDLSSWYANPYGNRGIILYHKKEYAKALAD